MKRNRLILTLFALLLALCALAGCGGQVDGISFSKSNMPRQTYVQGQELDLSVGKLTVKKGEESEEIPISSPEVTVSGYDKDKVGKQELTVSYQNATTTYTVTVTARMSASGHDAAYFVGEPFNREKGNLKITRDDGTSFSVPFSDESLTFDFDSSAAQNAYAVKVTYQNGEETYEGSIPVNIFAVESATLKQPNKRTYRSHEEGGLNLAGGYITLKGNGGKQNKNIALTADMVSGFDITAVQESNDSEHPLTQKITVTYAGREFTFDVNLTYSNVSRIQKAEKALKDLVWDEELPELSDELKETAFSALILYMGLERDDKDFLAQKEEAGEFSLLSVFRPAAVAGEAKWEEAISPYHRTFTAGTGYLNYVCESPAAVREDYEILKSGEGPVFEVAESLAFLTETYGEETVYGEVTFDSFLAYAYPPTGLESFVASLEYLLEVYETMKDFPAEGWTEETLSVAANVQMIQNAISLISSSGYTREDGALFDAVNRWVGGELFDILYTYCFKEGNTGDIQRLSVKRLPNNLEALYQDMYAALIEVYAMSEGYINDASPFMVYYLETLKSRSDLLADPDELTAYIYANVRFSGLFTSGSVSFDTAIYQLECIDLGYRATLGSRLGDPEFTAFWEQYAAIVAQSGEEGYLDGDAFQSEMQDLFQAFLALTPAQQFDFFQSVDILYGYCINEGTEYLIFDFDHAPYNDFSYLFSEWIERQNGDITAPVKEYLLALEHFARRPFVEGASEQFTAHYQAAEQAFGGVLPRLQALFKSKFGAAQTACRAANSAVNEGNRTALGTWKEKFADVALALRRMNGAITFIEDEEEPLQLLVQALSAYAYAEKVANEIRSADAAIVNAFLYEPYTEEELFAEYNLPLDAILSNYRGFYAEYLTGVTVRVTRNQRTFVPLYDYYQSGMEDFLAAAYNIIWTQFINAVGDVGTEEFGASSYRAADVMAAIKAFVPLAPEAKLVYLNHDTWDVVYDSATGYPTNDAKGGFLGGLDAYFSGTGFSAGFRSAVTKLLNTETAYLNYYAAKIDGLATADLLKTFKDTYQGAEDAASALPQNERGTFDAYFAAMEQHYLDLYNETY